MYERSYNYLNCGERSEDTIDHRDYTRNKAVAKFNPEKNSGLNEIRTRSEFLSGFNFERLKLCVTAVIDHVLMLKTNAKTDNTGTNRLITDNYH